MRLLKRIVNNKLDTVNGNLYKRIAARGIVIKNRKILLMYTKYYNDYSLPGGGVDSNESLIDGLKRELSEETGAQNIEVISEYGYIDEYRPYHKEEYDLMHMVSYLYLCKVHGNFKSMQLEDYEIANGMKVMWVPIDEAIKHNKEVIASSDFKGLSIERETSILEMIQEELF